DDAERARAAEASANTLIGYAVEVRLGRYPDAFFPCRAEDVKRLFEELKADVRPDVVFTHYRHDLHQDHRLVCELTWNTWRDHLIIEYEIPKYDGDLATPNVFVSVPEDLAREKADLIVRVFETQGVKHWFDAELFLGLMRGRG